MKLLVNSQPSPLHNRGRFDPDAPPEFFPQEDVHGGKGFAGIPDPSNDQYSTAPRLQPNTTEIVVAHYNEDVSWLSTLKEAGFQKILIGSKTSDPPYTPNKANEASTYAKYL